MRTRSVAVAVLCGVLAATASADTIGYRPLPQSPGFRALDAGAMHLLAGRFADAERAFRQALGLTPGLAEAMVGLSEVRSRQGDMKEARLWLDRALAAGSGNWLVQRSLARHLIRQKQFTQAESAYRTALAQNPNPDTYLELGDFYLVQLGWAWHAAEAYRAALALSPGNATARQALATSLAAAGQPEKSKQALREAARFAPNDRYVLLGHGLEQHQRGELDAALATLSRCIAANPRFVPGLMARANVHVARKDLGRALEDFNAARDVAPESGQVHASVGMVHLQAGRIEPAETAFLNAIRLDSGQADAYNNLAWLAAEKRIKANLDDALAWAQKAVALRPAYAPYLDTLGWVHQARGELAKAISFLEKAARLAPRDPDVARRLAELRTRERGSR